MNAIYRLLLSVPLTAALLVSSCTKTGVPSESRPAVIRVAPAPMTIVGEQVPYDTKALEPMRPEKENVIYTLAVFVFDVKEGVLRAFTEGEFKGKYYKYINYTDENGNGLLNTTFSTDGLPVRAGEKYTICLIANMTEAGIRGIVDEMMADGAAFFEEFKNIKVPIKYIPNTGNPNPDPATFGHVEDVYMFGYFSGDALRHKELNITLGRVISRIEIALMADDGIRLDDPKKKFYYQWVNLESHAYLFPGGKSPGVYVEDTRPFIINAEIENGIPSFRTFYGYSAPNAAMDENGALCLKLWYTEEDMMAEGADYSNPDAQIHLTNDQPGVSGRNWQLHRNSVYRFNITLTNK